MVFARGLMIPPPIPPGPLRALDTEFLRTRLVVLGGKPVVLSRRAVRGRDEAAPCWWSFCWCRSSRSRRAKHRAHWGHSKGFSFVCERSWRLRCSSRAKERVQVVQMCGRGLSVLGRGKVVVVVGDPAGFAVWVEVLLLFALPESSLGMLAVRPSFVASACEDMVGCEAARRQCWLGSAQ